MNPFIISTTNVLIAICFLVSQLLCCWAPGVAGVSTDYMDGNRRVPENMLKSKASATSVDTYDDTDGDDVFAIPVDDLKDYLYGRRLQKRSTDEYGQHNLVNRATYQAWGGKRARYPYDIFHMPKGFNPNGGKRSGYSNNGVMGDNSLKRTAKTFQNWAGKRTRVGPAKTFDIWGGKKRSDSFRTWGGK